MGVIHFLARRDEGWERQAIDSFFLSRAFLLFYDGKFNQLTSVVWR